MSFVQLVERWLRFNCFVFKCLLFIVCKHKLTIFDARIEYNSVCEYSSSDEGRTSLLNRRKNDQVVKLKYNFRTKNIAEKWFVQFELLPTENYCVSADLIDRLANANQVFLLCIAIFFQYAILCIQNEPFNLFIKSFKCQFRIRRKVKQNDNRRMTT